MKYKKYIKTIIYRRRLPRLVQEIMHKDRIRIIFFLPNLGMWKNEFLFKYLLKDASFEPIIVPFPHPWHTKEEQKAFLEEIKAYCKDNDFPLIEGYDIEKGTYLTAKELRPDIVVYTQPYNAGYDFWKIEKFWKKSIFVYSTYGAPIDSDRIFHFSLLQNICWKLFYPTPSLKYLFKTNFLTRGCNLSFVGDPMFDQFQKPDFDYSCWKSPDRKYKRLIWAPHHTILEKDYLHNSNFLGMADAMLEFAKEYCDKLQIAFKPHPYLKEKLYEIWGRDKTDNYYREWAEMPNTSYISGVYIDLFLSSDAMIHDCESFMCEYLYVKKPVMYILNDRATYKLNKLGNGCLNMHYKGYSMLDVRNFVNSVLLQGNDPMKSERDEFYKRELVPPSGRRASENMYLQLSSLHSYKQH